ncbi:MAG: right-handed parallel beta-helix repeat-containing protein [bacterium]
MRACAFFLFLSLALHGGRIGGSFPRLTDASPEERPREPRSFEASREVEDMRTRTMIGVVALGFAVSPALAVDRLVPEQYPTIEAAFAACSANDVVSVAPGTYNVGLVTMPAVPVTLRGRGLQSATVLEGEAIQIFSGSGSRVIENLTLRGMTGYGAIHVNGAAGIVRNVTIEMTPASGIFLNTNASVETINCTFRQNGKGGYAYVNCFWTAIDCSFETGNAVGSYGGAVGFHVGSGCSFLRCRFTSNYASQGGAIGLSFSGPRVFDQCFFEGNTSANGNVWWTEFGATGTLKNSVLCGHSPADFSGSWIDGGGNQFYPKGCTPACPADIVDDGFVNGADLATVLVYWGTNGSQFPGVDIDGNAVVNGADLAAVLAAWGQCPQ